MMKMRSKVGRKEKRRKERRKGEKGRGMLFLISYDCKFFL
jgi:hypothetical protein